MSAMEEDQVVPLLLAPPPPSPPMAPSATRINVALALPAPEEQGGGDRPGGLGQRGSQVALWQMGELVPAQERSSGQKGENRRASSQPPVGKGGLGDRWAERYGTRTLSLNIGAPLQENIRTRALLTHSSEPPTPSPQNFPRLEWAGRSSGARTSFGLELPPPSRGEEGYPLLEQIPGRKVHFMLDLY